jgi:hypothetical protein
MTKMAIGATATLAIALAVLATVDIALLLGLRSSIPQTPPEAQTT